MIFRAFFLALSLFPAVASAERTQLTQPGGGPELEVSWKAPRRAKASSLPAVLLFGGFETGENAIHLFDRELPVLLATFQYPLRLPRKIGWREALGQLPAAKRAIHQTIDGVDALVAWARSRPEVHPDRIILVGASFGTPFVVVSAGRNSAVRGLILAHGFVDVPKTAAHRLGERWRSKYGPLGAWLARALMTGVWWYVSAPDPAESVARLAEHQRVLLLTARDDDLLPPDAAESLRAGLRASKAQWEEKIIPGAHMRPGETALIRRLLDLSLDWVARQGWLGK